MEASRTPGFICWMMDCANLHFANLHVKRHFSIVEEKDDVQLIRNMFFFNMRRHVLA